MSRKGQTILADMPGFGRVYDCGDCGYVHCQMGAVSITFTLDSYMKLVDMVNTSAASLETWIQARNGESLG